MVTVQISIPEREWIGFNRMVRELKAYYDENQEREFRGKAYLRETFAGHRPEQRRRKISNAFVIRQAVSHFYDEIQRIQKEEQQEEDKNEVQKSNSPPQPWKRQQPWKTQRPWMPEK